MEELDKKSGVVGIINLLGELDKWVSEFPPIDQQQRFGNKSFREWHKRLEEVGILIDITLYYHGTTEKLYEIQGDKIWVLTRKVYGTIVV